MKSEKEIDTPSITRTANTLRQKAEAWAGQLGLLIILVALSVFIYQVYLWLRTGTWTPMPFYLLFSWLGVDLSPIGNMEWQGIKKIIIFVLEFPLSVMLILLGFTFIFYVPNLLSEKNKMLSNTLLLPTPETAHHVSCCIRGGRGRAKR